MSPEAEEIYNRLKLKPRRRVTAATVEADTKATTKNTAKNTSKPES